MTIDCNLLVNSLIRDCKKRLAISSLMMVMFKCDLMKVICKKSIIKEEKEKLILQLADIKNLKYYINDTISYMIEIENYLYEKEIRSKYFDKTFRKLINLKKIIGKVLRMVDLVSAKKVI